MLIGSVGSFEARFSPEECAHRLNAELSASSYVGHVDSDGFELSRDGRTAVRIRGGFTPKPMGCRVDYHVELIPWILSALVASYAVGFPVLVGLVSLAYLPSSVLVRAVLVTVFGLAINGWFSEQQGRELKDEIVAALGVE